MDTVLLTGFQPFLSYSSNPSEGIARSLDSKTISNRRIVGKVLPVAHDEVRNIIGEYVKKYKPVAIIALGIKAKIGCIALERVALNRYYFRDEKGEVDEPLYKNGQPAYFSTLPLKEIKESLQNDGIPAEFSFYPDTYVSNEAFYEIMRLAAEFKIRSAGFIHLPLSHKQVISLKMHYALKSEIPSMDEKIMEKAVRTTIETTLLNL